MSRWLWWGSVGVLAAALGWGFQTLEIPGGWFVASMLVAVVAGLVRPTHPSLTRPILLTPQAVIGTLIGASISPQALATFVFHLPAILGVLAITIAISVVAGIVLARTGALNRETATLGTLPGGATTMVMLSVGTAADTRVVALMQYLRLILVILVSTVVAHFLVHQAPVLPTSVVEHSWGDYVSTPVVAVLGVLAGQLVRLPTPALLGPMLLTLVASATGLIHPVLPWGISQLAYIVLGLYVGLLFDKESLVHARKLLPLLVTNVLVLLVLCALTGWAFSALTGASLLTGYLATSPGGGDTISIIALGSGADLSLVFSVQIFRAVFIMMAGSPIAKAVLHLTKKGESHD